MHTYENKNTKIYSEGLTAIYTKICTFQNFPLYSTCIHCRVEKDSVLKYALTNNMEKIKPQNVLVENYQTLYCGAGIFHCALGHPLTLAAVYDTALCGGY